jgi:flagellum-specific peptidoglycan hydrolase FlgJ
LGEDLRSWAKGLERMGYSRDERYAERLLQLIDQYHLDEISDTEL